ncbi:MAG: type II secretion system protein M [Idiomarina sp.]|nr:type II secretion system protein M [Idiomarina sp.]
MSERLAQLQEWYAGRVAREQYIIAVVSIALVAWLGFILLLEPASITKTNLERQIQQAQTQARNADQQVAALRAELENDPNLEIQRRQRQLQSRSTRLHQQLDGLAEFIEPEQLLDWIQAMLTNPGRAQESVLLLRSFDTYAPVPFLEDVAGGSVLQHNVTVELEGSYFAVRDYLQRLQDLPFGFYWQELDYQVDAYPLARIRLQLYTLSQANVAVSTRQGARNEE